jgi:hypothetical protein
LVSCLSLNIVSYIADTVIFSTGEAGKVDESIQKLAAVEALREEKSAKEVRPCLYLDILSVTSLILTALV